MNLFVSRFGVSYDMFLPFSNKCWISPLKRTPVQLADIGTETPNPFLK